MKKINKYGLIGRDINYSFSKKYFSNKFKIEKINCEYLNFDIENINFFTSIFLENNIKGLNVTIPYKESIITFLDEIDDIANKIGAVNTIKITNNRKIGFNTDYIGFKKSLLNFTDGVMPKNALLLGSGGATKAIKYALKSLNINQKTVSRKYGKSDLTYDELNKEIIKNSDLIINCTPLGTYPNINQSPYIPYEFLSESNTLFDLVYNPIKSSFLNKGQKMGCKIQNGLEMLKIQAEESWKIWNSPN